MTEQSTTDANALALLLGAWHGAAGLQPEGDIPGWTPEGDSWWADTVARLAGTRCPHVTDPEVVATGVAWVAALRCADCTDLETWLNDGAATCDRCGELLRDREMWGGVVQRGRVVIGVGLCLPCHAAIGGHPPEGVGL